MWGVWHPATPFLRKASLPECCAEQGQLGAGAVSERRPAGLLCLMGGPALLCMGSWGHRSSPQPRSPSLRMASQDRAADPSSQACRADSRSC